MANVSLKTKAMKLEGVDALVKTLREIQATLEGEGRGAFDQRAKEAMAKPAYAMRDEAKDLCPVVTGTLQAAISAGPLNKIVGAYITVHGVRYAAWVEYGTSKMKAHPFFRPGLNAVKPMAANMMAGDFKSLIEDIARADAWHAKDGSPPK